MDTEIHNPMRKKLRELYKNDYPTFKKLVKLFYDGFEDGEGLSHILIEEGDPSSRFFIIDGQLYSNETVALKMEEVAAKAKILQKFNII